MGSNEQDRSKTNVEEAKGRQPKAREPENRERLERRPTRILISRRTAKLLALAGIAALVLIAWYVPSALYIAVGGFALALILSFPVRGLSHFMPRGLAILLTYLVAIALDILTILVLVPLLVEQLGALISAAPDIARRGSEYYSNENTR